MRSTTLALSILSAAALAAQQPSAAPSGQWAAPAGWTVKPDGGAAAAETKFQTMGPGFHVTSGPAAIYYRASDVATGNFTVKATFGQRTHPSMGHPEAYGVFAGGMDLDKPSQQYMYLEVREDGKYFVAHRAGDQVHKIVDWEASDAVKKANEAGAATNEVGIRVATDSVHMMVNGVTVKSFAKKDLHGFVTDGTYGFRVNHMLNVHVANFGMSQ